jgi:acyl-CoA reductase-like NAD-dependent aldehyde dehydrogenase
MGQFGRGRALRVFLLGKIDPEIADLLELLDAREQFDEIAELFEQSSPPWHQYSAEERRRLVARAAAMMSRDSS